VATRALAWLELQMIRDRERADDDMFVDDLFRRTVAAAEPMAPADRLVEWRAIVADFDGLADVAPVRTRLDAVVRSQEGRALVRAERDEEKGQEQAMVELNRLAGDGEYPALRKLAAKWRQAAEVTADTSARRMARRVVGDAATYGREAGQEALSRQLFAEAIPLFELCAAFRPDRAPVFVDLARAYAGAGNRKRALAALQQAVGQGFSDAARIENAAEFHALSGDAAFQALIADARKNGER
jgi:thioredoxin-like negative regulator of GroEL